MNLQILSQRLQNLEQKDSESTGSRISSNRDSVHVSRQPVVKAKTQPPSSVSSAQPALHTRPTRVPNGFLYGVFVGSLYGPQSVFANGFLMGPI